MFKLQLLINKAKNEMAKIGVCNGNTVILNSNDHGKPHFHYGKVKIYLLDNYNNLSDCIDTKHKNLINQKDLIELEKWLIKPNKYFNKMSNLETLKSTWNMFHSKGE